MKDYKKFNKYLRDKYGFMFTKTYRGINTDKIWITGHTGNAKDKLSTKVLKDAEKYFGKSHIKAVDFKEPFYPSRGAIVIRLLKKSKSK